MFNFVKNNELANVTSFLKKQDKFDVNCHDELGNTPIHIAVLQNNLDIASIANAKVNVGFRLFVTKTI